LVAIGFGMITIGCLLRRRTFGSTRVRCRNATLLAFEWRQCMSLFVIKYVHA